MRASTVADSLRVIPDYEFGDEGIVFSPSSCNHGEIAEGTAEARDMDLAVNGVGEDHLLPPFALYAETYGQAFLEAETASEYRKAANPAYSGPSFGSVLHRSRVGHKRLGRELAALRDDERAYMELVRSIATEFYHIPSNSVLPVNHKLAKGIKHGWRTDGIVLAPNTVAGLGDVCPWRSPLCTANCLNLSGRAEVSEAREGDVMNARRRRTLMYMHVFEAFGARVAGLIRKRLRDHARYAVRLNVLSDVPWENRPFFVPWEGRRADLCAAFPSLTCYDYTKNCTRYERFLRGRFPRNYHLTLSLSEINALYAVYALVRGGAVSVVFDALPERIGGNYHVRYPAEPLPETFCGFPVIDGDETDLRFEDRERFGVGPRQGFVVGLRLKGRAHRKRYNKDRSAAAGFIFDSRREYDAATVIEESEVRRAMTARARTHRDLPGAGKQKFVGIPDDLAREAKQYLRV